MLKNGADPDQSSVFILTVKAFLLKYQGCNYVNGVNVLRQIRLFKSNESIMSSFYVNLNTHPSTYGLGTSVD